MSRPPSDSTTILRFVQEYAHTDHSLPGYTRCNTSQKLTAVTSLTAQEERAWKTSSKWRKVAGIATSELCDQSGSRSLASQQSFIYCRSEPSSSRVIVASPSARSNSDQSRPPSLRRDDRTRFPSPEDVILRRRPKLALRDSSNQKATETRIADVSRTEHVAISSSGLQSGKQCIVRASGIRLRDTPYRAKLAQKRREESTRGSASSSHSVCVQEKDFQESVIRSQRKQGSYGSVHDSQDLQDKEAESATRGHASPQGRGHLVGKPCTPLRSASCIDARRASFTTASTPDSSLDKLKKRIKANITTSIHKLMRMSAATSSNISNHEQRDAEAQERAAEQTGAVEQSPEVDQESRSQELMKMADTTAMSKQEKEELLQKLLAQVEKLRSEVEEPQPIEDVDSGPEYSPTSPVLDPFGREPSPDPCSPRLDPEIVEFENMQQRRRLELAAQPDKATEEDKPTKQDEVQQQTAVEVQDKDRQVRKEDQPEKPNEESSTTQQLVHPQSKEVETGITADTETANEPSTTQPVSPTDVLAIIPQRKTYELEVDKVVIDESEFDEYAHREPAKQAQEDKSTSEKSIVEKQMEELRLAEERERAFIAQQDESDISPTVRKHLEEDEEQQQLEEEDKQDQEPSDDYRDEDYEEEQASEVSEDSCSRSSSLVSEVAEINVFSGEEGETSVKRRVRTHRTTTRETMSPGKVRELIRSDRAILSQPIIHQDMSAQKVLRTRGLPQVQRIKPFYDGGQADNFELRKGEVPALYKKKVKKVWDHEAALARLLFGLPQQQPGDLTEAEEVFTDKTEIKTKKYNRVQQYCLPIAPNPPSWPVGMGLHHKREVTFMKRKLKQFRILKDQLITSTREQLIDMAHNEDWGKVPDLLLEGNFRTKLVTAEAVYQVWPRPFDCLEVIWLQKHEHMFPWAWSMPAEQAVYSTKLTEYQRCLRAYPSPHAVIWRNLTPPDKRPSRAEIGLFLTNNNPITDTKTVLLFYNAYRIKDWEPADTIDYSVLEMHHLVEELRLVAKHQSERFRRMRVALMKYRLNNVNRLGDLKRRIDRQDAEEAKEQERMQRGLPPMITVSSSPASEEQETDDRHLQRKRRREEDSRA